MGDWAFLPQGFRSVMEGVFSTKGGTGLALGLSLEFGVRWDPDDGLDRAGGGRGFLSPPPGTTSLEP